MLKILPEEGISVAILELKNSEKPLLIYGAGAQYGKKVKNYLSLNEIKVEGFLVNKEYYQPDTKELYGCPIYILEDYLAKNKCNIIIAFTGYYEDQLKKYTNNIYKVYALDLIGKLCLDEYDGTFSRKFYEENRDYLVYLEEKLSDEKSKQSLEDYIIQRMSGTYKKQYYDLEQYFPKDIIRLCEGEVFVDCGAYKGETAIDFIEHLQRQGIKTYKKIISVEPDKDNFKKMKENLKQYSNIETILAGVWSKSDILYMSSGLKDNSYISPEGSEGINVKSIDDILNGRCATYIKMDIEGSELEALHGAEKTIKKYKPKLAICIYHKIRDIIDIPQYIYSIRPDYKIYIRNHSPYGVETVLYAI